MSADMLRAQPAELDSRPQPAELDSLCKQAKALATGLPGALTRLTVSAGQSRVEVEWQPGSPAVGSSPAAAGPGAVTATAAADADVLTDAGYAVVAPLVGTFYRAAGPDAAPFVSEGDIVSAGQQVAIVEAMKMMNAVQAGQAGRVAKIMVTDGDIVEFGQPLMILEQADAET